MRISEKYKLIFLSTPKSGSHTGWKIMEDNFPITIKKMHINIVDARYKDFDAFSIVRNPYERAAALWHSLLHGDPSKKDRYRKIYLRKIGSDTFEAFTKWLASDEVSVKKSADFYIKLAISQTEYHSTCNLNSVTYHKVENLNESLPKYLFEKTGKQVKTVPHEHKRKHLSWDKLYTPENKKHIIEWAEKDFIAYNYSI